MPKDEIIAENFAPYSWFNWPRSSIRVVDWSIGRGLELPAIIEFLGDASPDVLLLQEVDICNVTPKQLDQDEGEILEWMRSQVEAIYVQQGRTTREITTVGESDSESFAGVVHRCFRHSKRVNTKDSTADSRSERQAEASLPL